MAALSSRSHVLEMEAMSELWETLPKDLLFDILELLPMSSLMKFRSVCQGWSRWKFFSFLREKFLEDVLQYPPFRNYTVLDCHGGFVLMGDLQFRQLPIDSDECFIYGPDFDAKDLCVVRPTTGFMKRIPYYGSIRRIGRFMEYTAGIVSNPGTKDFNIFMFAKEEYAIGDDYGPSLTFVYRYASATDTWQRVGEIAPKEPDQFSMIRGVVQYGGRFLILVQTQIDSWDPSFHEIIVLDEKTQKWENFEGGFLDIPVQYKSPLLFTHGGTLFLTVMCFGGIYLYEYVEEEEQEEEGFGWHCCDKFEVDLFTPKEVADMDAIKAGPWLPREQQRLCPQVEKALFQVLDGDFLYFGRRSAEDSKIPSVAICYDMINWGWNELPLEEEKHKFILGPQDTRLFYHTNVLPEAMSRDEEGATADSESG